MNWVTKHEEEIPISDIDDDHLVNIYSMLHRWKCDIDLRNFNASKTIRDKLDKYWKPICKEMRNRFKTYSKIEKHYKL